jgi:hypothetical protein
MSGRIVSFFVAPYQKELPLLYRYYTNDMIEVSRKKLLGSFYFELTEGRLKLLYIDRVMS